MEAFNDIFEDCTSLGTKIPKDNYLSEGKHIVANPAVCEVCSAGSIVSRFFDEGYIKEYRKDGLHSHNPEFRTMTFHEDQSVRCLGRVIGKVKEEQIPTKEQVNRIAEAARAGKEPQ